jgi:hypothetical protein
MEAFAQAAVPDPLASVQILQPPIQRRDDLHVDSASPQLTQYSKGDAGPIMAI